MQALRLLQALSTARRRLDPVSLSGELRLENAELDLDAFDRARGYSRPNLHPALPPGRPASLADFLRPFNFDAVARPFHDDLKPNPTRRRTIIGRRR